VKRREKVLALGGVVGRRIMLKVGHEDGKDR
jgi:hypothetical protein